METGGTPESSSFQSQKYSSWGQSRKGKEGGREPGPEEPLGGAWVDIWGGTCQGAGTSAGFVGRTSWKMFSCSIKQCRYFKSSVIINLIFLVFFLQSLKFCN